MTWTFRPLTNDQWTAFESLTCFPQGACWCAINHYATMTSARWDQLCTAPGTENRQQIEACLARGFSPGTLMYDKELAVGWCSWGPLPEFARFAARAQQLEAEASRTACIVCWSVLPERRRTGVMRLLLQEVIRQARVQGFAALEAYPLAEAELAVEDRAEVEDRGWMGFPAVFREAGFTALNVQFPRPLHVPDEVPLPNRPIYRLALLDD